MAMPRVAFGRALTEDRPMGVGAAAVVFVATLGVLIGLVARSPASAPSAQIGLDPTLRGAPAGWREALAPAAGALMITEDMVRLSERPLTPAAAIAQLPITDQSGSQISALPPAPITGFFAPGPGGPLPIIAANGRTPFEAYKRPFVANGRPKVALVIGGLGLNSHATRQAIESLPPEITLSFAPYADGLQGWIDMARAHGHEVLLETPMEPLNYPDNDPGPYTLMAEASPPEVIKKLEWVMTRATGYFGLTNYLGARFLTSDTAYQAFAGAAASRGLGFIDDGSAARRNGGLPRASADRVVDDQLSQAAIDQQLAALESGALQRGHALGAGFAYPVTLDKVAHWAAGLSQRGFQLAPASALTSRN